jgi:Zn-finger nucleic acid-binding protein
METDVIKCRQCGHSMKSKVRYCPMCGAEIVSVVRNEELQCPRCQCGLENFDYRETKLEKCPDCGGLWIHVEEFKLLTSERDVYRDDKVNTHFARKSPPGIESYLPCAQCGRLMNRTNFKHISGVIIDFCRDCGYWLDAGELEQIRSFVAAGGLDAAQDRELASHATEIGSLDTRVSDLECMQKLLHLRSLKRWLFKGF